MRNVLLGIWIAIALSCGAAKTSDDKVENTKIKIAEEIATLDQERQSVADQRDALELALATAREEIAFFFSADDICPRTR